MHDILRAALALSLAPLVTPAQEAAAPTGLEALQASVVEHRLENGWTFLLVPREGAPVVSFHTYIDVGGIYEDDGAIGMAHMFEHMAFKGSDRIGTTDWAAEQVALDEVEVAYAELSEARAAGDAERIGAATERFVAAQERAASYVASEEFTRILEEAGGATSLNATTSAEETEYMVSLPSNRLELWCWMERERFGRPVMREFYKEREAVKEERRMRVDSSPFGALLEELYHTAFTIHPYRRPVIGYAADLDRFTRTEAEAFYAEHYGVRRFVTGWMAAYGGGVQRRTRGDAAELETVLRYGVGTTEYMRTTGGYALTLECGQHLDPQAPEVAYRAILNTLAHLELIDAPAPEPVPFDEMEALQMVVVHDKQDAGDAFTRAWASFDPVQEGEQIGTRADGTPVLAEFSGRILFPDAKAGANSEWYYLTRANPEFGRA